MRDCVHALFSILCGTNNDLFSLLNRYPPLLVLYTTIPPDSKISNIWAIIHDVAAPKIPYMGMRYRLHIMQMQPTVSPTIGAKRA